MTVRCNNKWINSKINKKINNNKFILDIIKILVYCLEISHYYYYIKFFKFIIFIY